jgi:hypothetical protein
MTNGTSQSVESLEKLRVVSLQLAVGRQTHWRSLQMVAPVRGKGGGSNTKLVASQSGREHISCGSYGVGNHYQTTGEDIAD